MLERGSLEDQAAGVAMASQERTVTPRALPALEDRFQMSPVLGRGGGQARTEDEEHNAKQRVAQSSQVSSGELRHNTMPRKQYYTVQGKFGKRVDS